MDRKAIKAKAKEFAFKNKWNIWKPTLVYFLIVTIPAILIGIVLGLTTANETTAQNISDLISNIITIATLPMSVGITAYTMKLIKGQNMTVKEALFSKYSMFWLIFFTCFVVGLFTTLWTLLLIIPGIIYSYKMIMIEYIMAEDDANTMTCKEVMERSEKLMDGHKMEYFKFELSFIGWALISVFTLGIGLIWTIPYIEVATIMFYEELKKLAN